MTLREKLKKLAEREKNFSDKLEKDKSIWIDEVKKLYKDIESWFRDEIKKNYMVIEYPPLENFEYEEFFNMVSMQINLGGRHGPAVIIEPVGINIAGALGNADLYFRGHKDEGVFLLLIKDEDNGELHWVIWRSRKEKEIPFNKDTLENLLNEWLEKWEKI
jgi:hypothetical protein